MTKEEISSKYADDDGGKAEASICLITTDGEGVGFYESNIQSIEIL